MRRRRRRRETSLGRKVVLKLSLRRIKIIKRENSYVTVISIPVLSRKP
jgi:hypothetical protein